MDLSKAKSVLIYTFLILNIFLVSQILLDEGRGETSFFGRKEELSRLESALQEAGLFLETPLPKGGLRLAHMVVEPWFFKPEEIVSVVGGVFLNDEKISAEISEQVKIAKDGNEGDANRGDGTGAYYFRDFELAVNREGLLTFKKKDGGKLQEVFAPEEKKQAAQEFCGKISFLDSFIYDYSRKEGKGTGLYFSQEYDGFPLHAGYLHFLIEEGALLELSFYRLEPVGFAEQKREIIPPSTALLRFVEAYEKKEEKREIKEIVDFSLGFYSRQYDAERWEIPPAWRIRLDNNEIYYINAFTGILEQ